MRIVKFVVLGVVALLAVVLAYAGGETPAVSGSYDGDVIAVREAIDSANSYWCEAYSNSDSNAIMDVYAENPVSLSSTGTVTHGREEIRRISAKFMAEYAPVDVWVNTQRVWLVDPVTAYEYGDYGMTLAPEGQDTIRFEQDFVAHWKQQADGTWKTQMTMTFPVDDGDSGE